MLSVAELVTVSKKKDSQRLQITETCGYGTANPKQKNTCPPGSGGSAWDRQHQL